MKVGIMGGTFNPIHMAHLILAQSSLEQLGLQKILFMPSKRPPHKRNDLIADDKHREKMVELAIQNNPSFELSRVELLREGTTYTSDTLQQLNQENPDITYYFILGADSLFQLENWWEPEVILKLAHIVAAVRGQETREELKAQAEHLTAKFHAKIHILNTPYLDIASHELRDKLSKGNSIRYMVPEAVYEYIREHQLYTGKEQKNDGKFVSVGEEIR